MFKLVRINRWIAEPEAVRREQLKIKNLSVLILIWLQIVASCILAVASAGYIAQPAVIHTPVAVHAVHAPVATSYQSSHVVHHSAPIVKA